jgi:hypothetical protein
MKTPDDSHPAPASPEPGEDFNVRLVHGRIWREWSEPTEKNRHLPWYLHIFYFGMFFWGYVYFVTYAGDYRWDEYEHRLSARAHRDFEARAAAAAKQAATPAPKQP